MNRGSKGAWLVVFVLLLAVAALGATVYALMTPGAKEPDQQAAQTAREMGMTDEEHANMDVSTDPASDQQGKRLITFSDDGFDKSTYVFSQGPVTVKNESSVNLQFSSDDHPSHRDHTELNMNVLGPGESGTFTPPGLGIYGFHDHINDQFKATLTIE